jgi:hypothetical protein
VLNRKLAVKFPVVIINNSKNRFIIENKKKQSVKNDQRVIQNHLLIKGLAHFVP